MGDRHNINNNRVNLLQRQRARRSRTKRILERQGLLPSSAVTTAHPLSAKKERQLKTALKLRYQRLAQKGKVILEAEMKDALDVFEGPAKHQEKGKATPKGPGTTLGGPPVTIMPMDE